MKPHVDTSTKKIYGCEKGSWHWYHEEGHLVFNDEYSWMLMVKSYIFDLWMLFVMVVLVFRQAYPFLLSTWAIYIFMTIYEEFWCNKYADYKTQNT